MTSGEQMVFAFVREGPSDDGLLPHLRDLLVRAGLDEVVGSARDYKGPVAERLRKVAAEEARVDIIFVHRDADSPIADARHSEVRDAAATLDASAPSVVPVVPIQELEAWLLLDEAAIRSVVGKPSGKVPLDLPKLSQVEKTSSPKEVLAAALVRASETTGRRLKQERSRFPIRRRVLLERLDIDGPIRGLSAWAKLESDIEGAVSQLLESRSTQEAPSSRISS